MANEKRLIDANEIPTYILEINCDNYSEIQKLHVAFVEDIESMPTVDSVKVVRCKDCKHWHKETGWCNHHSHFIGSEGEACHPWESNDWKMLNADDFCSYGEREGNERT